MRIPLEGTKADADTGLLSPKKMKCNHAPPKTMNLNSEAKQAYGYFIEFIVTFDPKCPPEQLSTTAVKKVDTGHFNVTETIGQGALGLGMLHFLNNVDRIIDGESISRDNVGGRWSKGSGKGGNVGAVGDIALDKEGLKMHNSFIQFMINLQKHDSYDDVNQQIFDRWMEKKAHTRLERANKRRRKTSKCTEETEAPEFDCILGG
ncbi:hypothetical protein THAOC_24738 [Thalassiosira oceanica]|uniref:Uncharacterized protein n=1 Tax=Thalassiosira oceanica TaxID=159749 RepID=K0S3G4_THAOC|nr:hypothetical protein THAOC_24738 [Thalassiosira oceanica]|eukprot:EJK55526.1 hypothetical protein THAOC_24738 [Thalassiosira oceanica]